MSHDRMWTPNRRISRLSILCVAATAVASFAAAPCGAQPATPRTVEEVVERAHRYVVEYGTALSLVIGVEQYRQSVQSVAPSVMGVAPSERPWTRRTVSEFALIRVNDDWLGYRDVFQVDGKTVGDRQDRLQQLFQQSPATAVDLGRNIADESARYNAGAVQRNFNVPTMALLFVHPSNASRFRFEKAGTDTIDRTPVWKVRYREIQEPTIIRTSEGKSVPVSGMLWIDPTQGRILKTSLEVKGEAELSGGSSTMQESLLSKTGGHGETPDRRVETYSRVTTSYKPDERLGLLLPAEMVEEYQGVSVNRATGRDRLTKISCRATYTDFKRFDVTGRVIVPK